MARSQKFLLLTSITYILLATTYAEDQRKTKLKSTLSSSKHFQNGIKHDINTNTRNTVTPSKVDANGSDSMGAQTTDDVHPYSSTTTKEIVNKTPKNQFRRSADQGNMKNITPSNYNQQSENEDNKRAGVFNEAHTANSTTPTSRSTVSIESSTTRTTSISDNLSTSGSKVKAFFLRVKGQAKKAAVATISILGVVSFALYIIYGNHSM